MSPISWKIRASWPLVGSVRSRSGSAITPDGRGSGGDDPVAASALGLVERAIGFALQIVDRLVGRRRDGDTDRDAHGLDPDSAQVERADSLADTLTHLERD